MRVNDELELDAGTLEQAQDEYGELTLIRPPAVTLFHQVLAYLRSKPAPAHIRQGTVIGHEGVAAAAVTLRWGSYYCVLADATKPVWEETRSPTTSRISDGEMARINIESSAAMAEWVDLMRRRASGSSSEYMDLVDRAVAYLPMPQKTSSRDAPELEALAHPDFAAKAIQVIDGTRLEAARARAREHPSRVFSNAVVNTAWRNSPVERIHAGQFRGYPLDKRRITTAEDRTLMRVTGGRMAAGMWACFGLVTETLGREWSDQVLPYGAAPLLVTPSNWTLTESSREVRLPAFDPSAPTE